MSVQVSAPRPTSFRAAGRPVAAGAAAFEAYLEAHRKKDVLRFITCGSVDDGKSTLIGRLLHDAHQLFDDQLASLARESRKHGTQGGAIDFALLVDGLAAEREQGITIDVAYRFFSTEKRSFIVADTPGHVQFTRNMATGASTADLAILLVDARKGLSEQTRRHSLILSILGIRRIVLAINKMDLVGWSKDQYLAIMAEYRAFSAGLGFGEVTGIPLSALNGDNVVHPAVAAPWYGGLPLLHYLETVDVLPAAASPFRMPVQWINRPNSEFRGASGLIASGTVAVGERVRVWPSGRETAVAAIVTFDGELDRAVAGQSVTLTFADEIDISRGAVIAAADETPLFADKLAARLFFAGDAPLAPGSSVQLKLGAALVGAVVETISARIDPTTLAAEPAQNLAANEIGDVVLALDRPIAFEPYATNRDLGSFILIDRVTADTIALGLAQGLASGGSEKGLAMTDQQSSLLGQSSSRSPARADGWIGALTRKFSRRAALGLTLAATLTGGAALVMPSGARAQTQLLNVSYDPTRELYREINEAFAASWKKETGETVIVRASHGGSGRQARSVIDGLNADVLTLALAGDIDEVARATKKLPLDWQKRLPNNASPYTSTIVFVVRKGNPKGVKDWDDLAKPGVAVITPNPKTSGGARWNYLAAWGYALDKWKDEGKAKDFVQAIFKNVPVLDTGARGSTTTFAQRAIGDVFISWENEAFLTLKEFGEDKFEIVVPSISILAEPPVALVDGNVDQKGTRKAAQAYLDFLYSDVAQAIIAKNFYRPSKREAAAKGDLDRLPNVKLFTIDEVFGGWAKTQKVHFDDGGVFDVIVKANR